MKPIFHSTLVSKGGLALFLLVLIETTTDCNARISLQQQDDELSRQTTSIDWRSSEGTQILQQQQIVNAPSSTEHEESTRVSAYDYDERGPGSRLNNEPPPTMTTTTATTKVYERVVLEGSKISISCPHYTPTIAPAETLFAKIQRNSNPNELKHPNSMRRYKESDEEAAAAGIAAYEDELMAALNSNSELPVKWFRNHVPLQNLNHFHHHSSQAQHGSSSSLAAYDERQVSASLFEATTTTFASTAGANITELNRTTELYQTKVPATVSDKQQWQAAQRNLLKTSGPASSIEGERTVGSLTSESVNELSADDRKPTNMPKLQRRYNGQQSQQQQRRRQHRQQWYVNKFGELVINEVSRCFAGKYTCLVEGKQSEVLLDVLLDSQAADKKLEQAYRVGEETVMSVSDGPDVSGSKVVASETSALASSGTKITALYASGGGNYNNESAFSLSNERSDGDEKARGKTGSRPTVDDEEEDNSASESRDAVAREDDSSSSLISSLSRVSSSAEQLPEPTTVHSFDRQGGIQETRQHSLVDKNSSEIQVNSIKTHGDGVTLGTGSSKKRLLSPAFPPPLSLELDYVLKGGGNNYKAAEGKVESSLSVPSASKATEIISDLRSYMFPRKHLTQTPTVHLVISEVILMSDLKSVPGFLYTKQQLNCPVAFSQRELKREYIYPLILALCPKARPQEGHANANLARGNKRELQRREIQCYHLAERVISQLTHNCSTSVLDLVWFKDGKLLEFDANGIGKDRELNVKVIDSLAQFNTTASEFATNSSSARFGQSTFGESNTASFVSLSSSSQLGNLKKPGWTCPIFSGRTLEIDGVRRDSAGRYTCAFRLSIAKLEEIILRQTANTNASKSDSSSSIKRNPGSLLSSVNWSQPAAHDNDISCCDEHGPAPIQLGFHSAAKHNSRSMNARHRRRRRHHQQQTQQQSLQLIEAQIETNVSKTIASNSNGQGSTAASRFPASSEHQEQRQINLTHNGGARLLSKRIAILKSILRAEPAREKSLNYIGRTLSRLQIPLEAAPATTTIQTFSLLVTERAANSCDLWSTIAEAGNAYTRRKFADFKRLRRSVAVDRRRQQTASRRSARGASRYSSASVYANTLKNVSRDKSSSMVDGRARFETASMAIQSPDGSNSAAVVVALGSGGQEAVANAEPETLKARPIKRLNVNIDGSVRQLSIDSRSGGRHNTNGEYSMNERRPIGQYRPSQLRRPNQAATATDGDDDSLEEDDEASRSSSRRGGFDISVGGKQNVGPIDERSKRNDQEKKEEATLNALHLMPDNNDSSETLVFTDYQQGYNLLLNNADELESDIETSPADTGQTKSDSGARSNARGASSNEGGGGGDDDDDSRDLTSRDHYRRSRSLLHKRTAVSTASAAGAQTSAFAPTPFNYANEANTKLGSHDERSTGSSNPIPPTATRAGAPGASSSDEASSRQTESSASDVRAGALEGDRRRFNMMIEANHDYSLAGAETKDLITQGKSANHLVGNTAVSSAAVNGNGYDLNAGQQPTFVGLASGEFQTDRNPMVIDDQQDKVARPIIDGNLAGERLASQGRRGYVSGATNGASDVGAKSASGNAYFEQRDSRQKEDHDAVHDKDFEADYQANADIGSSSNEEPLPSHSHRLRRSHREDKVGVQEAAKSSDRGDETSSQAAASAEETSRYTGRSSVHSSGSFAGLLTNSASRERRKSRRPTKSDVKSYVAALGETETGLSWPTRAIDEKARDKRQDPLQGNKLLLLTIGDSGSGSGGNGDQSSSWQANEGNTGSGSRDSIANNPKSRSEDNQEDDDDSSDGASQLNGPATQYSALGSQFLIDVQTESTGETASRKVSSTNQSALPVLEAGRGRNFVAGQQITSADLAPVSSPKRRGEKAVARLQATLSSSSYPIFDDNSHSEANWDDAEGNQNRDQNYERGSISFPFAAASNDQAPIFSDDRLDESLMWTAGQYLYMHMKALATSSIFGVEVDVEWSNERTNGSTNIDLSDDVDQTEPAATATHNAVSNSAEWQANRQVRYAPPHLHDAAPFATIDVISGQSLTLQCTAQALGRLPEVKWYKRIHTLPLRLKNLVKMVRRIGHDLYWPLSEIDLLKDDNSKQSFACSQTSTIFDNLANQTFTMVNSLQLSQYNDVIEQETVRTNSLTAGGDYNLYACIVDADVRHNYATLGVHLRQAPRKIAPELSKRLHARLAVLNKSPVEPISSTPHMRLIPANKVTDHHQQTYTNYDLYREAQQLQFPMKDFWVPIQNESHLKRASIVESPLTPALLSTLIGFVFISLVALLYLTFRSYRNLTNFQIDFDAEESLDDSINLSINPQCEMIAHPSTKVQEQEQSNERGESQLICSCQFEADSNDNNHSLTTSSVMMIEDGSSLFNPENVIYTRFDQDTIETSAHHSSMPPTFRYDTCSPPYRLCPYSNLHPQVPREASDIWPQSHASFYGEQALNLEAH